MRSRKLKWNDMSPRAKTWTVIAGTVQFLLALCAWVDLARRRPDQVNGKKSMWAGVIGINFVGPILYFARGRRRTL